jgi:ATP-binding cassette, subfamily F, member 2
MTSLSTNASQEDLKLLSAQAAMAKLNTATDRYVQCGRSGRGVNVVSNHDYFDRSANGVLVSDPKSRDIKIEQYSLSFHGRLLIEGAEISLNYGQRYGLLGENGSGKVR